MTIRCALLFAFIAACAVVMPAGASVGNGVIAFTDTSSDILTLDLKSGATARDTIDCGKDVDTAIVDPVDRLASTCETVLRR